MASNVRMNDKGRRPSRVSVTILICFNIVFALCGVAILSLGILVLKDMGRHLLFRLVSPGSSIIVQVGSALLGIGAFAFLTAILGCSTAARKCSIAWYITCVILVLLGELAIGVSFLFFHDTLGKDLDNSKLVSTLHTSYGFDQPFTQSMDYAQNRFNCCGVDGDADYERSSWRSGRLGSDLLFPLTCCPLDDDRSDPPPFMNPVPVNLTACQILQAVHQPHRYREGCLSPIEEWFRKQMLSFVGMSLTLLVLQISTLASAICLCRKIS